MDSLVGLRVDVFVSTPEPSLKQRLVFGNVAGGKHMPGLLKRGSPRGTHQLSSCVALRITCLPPCTPTLRERSLTMTSPPTGP